MVTKADFGIEKWSREDKVSDYTRKLVRTAEATHHLIAKGSSKYEVFDPQVVCVAVEDYSKANPNTRHASNLLAMMWGDGDYLITSGEHGSYLSEAKMPEDNLYGFLRWAEGGARRIGLRDNREVLQELEAMQWRNPLHRIEDREEVILRGVHEALKGSPNSPTGQAKIDKGKLYLVLDWRHLMDVNMNPDRKDNFFLRGYRDSYLIYDFLDAEGIPYAVVAPGWPSVSHTDQGIANAWFSVLMACNNYDGNMADIEVAGGEEDVVIQSSWRLRRKKAKLGELLEKGSHIGFDKVEEEVGRLGKEMSEHPKVKAAFNKVFLEKRETRAQRIERIKHYWDNPEIIK